MLYAKVSNMRGRPRIIAEQPSKQACRELPTVSSEGLSTDHARTSAHVSCRKVHAEEPPCRFPPARKTGCADVRAAQDHTTVKDPYQIVQYVCPSRSPRYTVSTIGSPVRPWPSGPGTGSRCTGRGFEPQRGRQSRRKTPQVEYGYSPVAAQCGNG